MEGVLAASPPRWRDATKAVLDAARQQRWDSREGDAPRGVLDGDDILATLQCWLLVLLVDLDHRAAMQAYEKQHRDGLARAAGIHFARTWNNPNYT